VRVVQRHPWHRFTLAPPPKWSLRRIVWMLLAGSALLGGLLAYRSWQVSNQPPLQRLALDATYETMPADAHHHYLNLPLDYEDAGSPQFRDFYILSPGFKRGEPVVFFFTDGQMELVSPRSDTAFFDAELPGLSYVLVGHRGHAPTLFPEVYVGGKVDLRRALRLYGSAARVEDIERVRRDMLRQGLLPEDGRIMIFAASGAGMLAQQYLGKYGEHVSRVLLASTGAPDLASARGWDYARGYADYDPVAAALLARVIARDKVSPASLGYLLYQLGRQGGDSHESQRGVLDGLEGHNRLPYLWHWSHPSLNFYIARKILAAPAAEAVKVRMFELLAADLRKSRNLASADAPLLYSWASTLLADYLRADLSAPDWRLDRGAFGGEVLVITGADDIVFSSRIGALIAGSYPDGKFVVVRGGHRLESDRDYQARLRAAFFLQGLHAAQTESLLASPPAGSMPRKG
jgi:pimeloyl-ACP methyl ester carboxylesterase